MREESEHSQSCDSCKSTYLCLLTQTVSSDISCYSPVHPASFDSVFSYMSACLIPTDISIHAPHQHLLQNKNPSTNVFDSELLNKGLITWSSLQQIPVILKWDRKIKIWVKQQSHFLLKSLPLQSEMIITARPRDNNWVPYSNLIESNKIQHFISLSENSISTAFISRQFSVKFQRRQDTVTLMQFLELQVP